MSVSLGRPKRKTRRKNPIQSLVSAMSEYTQKTSHTFGWLLNREWREVKNIAKGVGDEVVSIMISLNLYPWGLVNLDRLDVLKTVSTHRPVLLVHGYFHNNSSFYLLKRRLHREGWKHVYRINLRTYTMGIEECAQEISKKVEAIRKATGAEKIDIIGHSFGGLCSRYYVQSLDGAEKVAHCICIGTPHGGSSLAGLGFGLANLDMQPGSDVLRELNEELELPPHVEFTNIWSPFDYMVIPIENAIMEGRVRNIKVDYLGHQGLLYSRRVFNDIFLTLSSDSIHRKFAPKKKAEAGPAAKGDLSYLSRS